MKGINRVRILKSFKSLQPLHSSIDHSTAYDHIQSAEKLSLRTPQSHSSYKEHNSALSIKDVADCSHSPVLEEAEDVFKECDEEELRDENLETEISPSHDLLRFEQKCPPGGSNSVILYTTSLRGIRKTFDDCHNIKFLLDSFRIVYHERDVSMHLEFREEMWEMLGCRVIPPKLFIQGRYVGGADEVVSLHERGELKNLLQGLPLVPGNQKCRGCNNLRFVLCCECHGSRKVFRGEARDGSFARCLSCNENGLIKCPLCS